MNEAESKQRQRERELQKTSDQLFAACLQFMISKEDVFLVTIRDLSQKLLTSGYETRFEHRKRALIIRNMFNNLTTHLTEPDERLLPRSSDLQELPDAS